MDKQPLEYNKHCTIPFGAFAQENNDNNPKKSRVLQTIDGIDLQTLDNIQGGHEIFHPHSHRGNIRCKFF